MSRAATVESSPGFTSFFCSFFTSWVTVCRVCQIQRRSKFATNSILLLAIPISFLILSACWQLLILCHHLVYYGIERTLSPSLTNKDARHFNVDIRSPLPCRTGVRRFGSSGDGGWDVCLDGLDPLNCVVYSVGISNDPSFDLAIADFGCQVFSFDPTIGRKTGDDFGPRVHFYNLGLAAEDFFTGITGLGHAEAKKGAASSLFSVHSDRGYEMKKLSSIMRDLGHDFVDILKLDIEGYEWDVFDGLLKETLLGDGSKGCSRIGSLLAEYHFGKFGRRPFERKDKVSFLGRVRRLGFEVFSRSENWRFGSRMHDHDVHAWNCMEVGMILSPEFRCSRH